jgi:hypothetical protein
VVLGQLINLSLCQPLNNNLVDLMMKIFVAVIKIKIRRNSSISFISK